MVSLALRTHLLTLTLAMLVALGCLGAVYAAWAVPDDALGVASSPMESPRDEDNAPPALDPELDSFLPNQKQDLSPDQAVATNLASPLIRVNPMPPAFNPAWLSAPDLAAATDCMAKAIYYEANGEPAAGQMAVAQVILNRVRHPRFPKTVCGVVFQGSDRPTGCQFTFTCDGSMNRPPNPVGLARARGIADAALHGAVSYIAGQATHYHTIWIVPVWAHQMNKVAIVGHHVFYRPPAAYGGWPALVSAGANAASIGAAAGDPLIVPVALDGPLSGSAPSPGQSLVAAPDSPSAGLSAQAAAAARGAAISQAGLAAPADAMPGQNAAIASAPASSLFGEIRHRRSSLALPSD